MERHAIVIDGWPTLMSLDLALRYLSIDEASFFAVADDYCVEAVEVRPNMPRWKKADLDRLLKRLPTWRGLAATHRQPEKLAISDADLERLAVAISRHMGSGDVAVPSELVSIKDASRMVGLGRTTLYNLINEGRLETRQIGRRRLVLRSSIAALLADKAI